MIEESQVMRKLKSYGLNVSCLTERSLQEKIIEIYEILEEKTTQNLLLKKQNDDIRLQIDTINDLFAAVSADIHLKFEQNPIILPEQAYTGFNKQSSNQLNKNESKIQKKIIGFQKNSISDRLENKLTHFNNYQKQSEKGVDSSFDSEGKTSRYPSNFFQRVGLNEKMLNNQHTKRGVTVKTIKKSQKSIEEKMQFLIQQNQLIIKRMNQIEARFIKTNEQQIRKQALKKSIDDKETNYSSNTPSLKKSSNIKDNPLRSKNLISQAKSTSNLKSYRQSIA